MANYVNVGWSNYKYYVNGINYYVAEQCDSDALEHISSVMCSSYVPGTTCVILRDGEYLCQYTVPNPGDTYSEVRDV